MTLRPLVVFVAANAAGARTGNERTLCRLMARLDEAGVDVVIARPDQTPEVVLAAVQADGRRAALVHAFHARRSGPRGVDLARRLAAPLVVGLTGTDLVRDIFVEDRVGVVLDVLRAAAVITCGNADEAQTVGRLIEPSPPCFVLPKGTNVPRTLPTPALERGDERVLLQIAHVRPVKNVALAIRVTRELARDVPVRLVVLGDVLDDEYAAQCEREAGGADAWSRVRYPAVSPEDVGGFLASADVVLNTSHGEGGSNAVLEAMAHGKPVVASAVPGNVAYVGRDGARGVTYPVSIAADGSVAHDQDACLAAIRTLLDDPARCERVGASAREWVLRNESPDAERAALLRAYAVTAPASFPPA